MKGLIKALCVLLMLYGLTKVIMETLRVTTIIFEVKDAMNECCVYVLNENYDDIYKSIRDGYTGAYRTDGRSSFSDYRDYADIVSRLVDILAVETDGETYVKPNDDTGHEYYKFYDVSVTLTNTGLRRQQRMYYIDMYLKLDVPMQLSKINFPLTINLHSSSIWTPKYEYNDLRKFH